MSAELLSHRDGNGIAFWEAMFEQLAGPGNRGFQPGAKGSSGLWVGPGLADVLVGPGLGVQVAPTGQGLCRARPGRDSGRLELPGTGVGTAEWVALGVKVRGSRVGLGRALRMTAGALRMAAGRCDLSRGGAGAPTVTCATCWIGPGSTPTYAAVMLLSPAAAVTSAAASGSLARAGRPDSRRRAGRMAGGETLAGETSRANAASAVASPARSPGSAGPATVASIRARSCISGGAPGGIGRRSKIMSSSGSSRSPPGRPGGTQASHHA